MLETEYLFLYGQTAVFIYVFMEVMVASRPFRHVMLKYSSLSDKMIVTAFFGIFSIFGTLIGVELPSGAIMNVRDFGPMIAGLIGGPLIGLVAGLMGGIHRFLLGGFVAVPCGISTVLSGIFCGIYYNFRGRRLVNRFEGVMVAVLIECLHMGIVLLLARPFNEALDTVKDVMFPMIIANALAIFFSIMIINREYTNKVEVPENNVQIDNAS